MKIELFVLPQVMRRDFMDAFVLEREDFAAVHPDWVHHMDETSVGFDGWYDQAFLWDKMSPDIPVVDFARALELLRGVEGKVLFLSESETSGHDGGLVLHGRKVYDFVAIADPQELADLLEYEWNNDGSLYVEGKLTLPSDVYVFDTTLEWVLVFTHEWDDTDGGVPARYCKAFGFSSDAG
jgi:hypothetical protein